MSFERNFEREERVAAECRAFAATDRITTMVALGVPATIGRIIPPPRTAAAESVDEEIVDLAGILTEGETQ